MTFFVALFGCVTALALTFAVFLRPFLPSTIGLWLGSEGFDVGVLSHPETQHELLGQWFVPVISLAAFLAAIPDYAGAAPDDPQAFSQCDLPCAPHRRFRSGTKLVR
jgi:hypothetical protein